MKCFLTSSPVLSDTNKLNPANGFLDKLKICIPLPAKPYLSAPIPTVTNVPFDLLRL